MPGNAECLGRGLPLRAANLSETTELQNDFRNHKWNRPICPSAYVIQSNRTDSLTHKRHIRDDPIAYDPSPRKNIKPNHPLLMRLNVSQSYCIVSNRCSGEPENSVEKETEAIHDTAEAGMQSHVERGAANERPGDQENPPKPGMGSQITHPKSRPKLPGADEYHCDCAGDVRANENSFGPECFETLGSVAEEVM